MSRVFFDTNLFIYWLEDRGERGARVAKLVQRVIQRGDQLLTSTLTLAEVLARPLAAGDLTWAASYEHLLDTPGVLLLPFDRACARMFGHVRKDRTIKPPDAIQLACASVARCDLFITNDDRLSQKIVPGIQFITSLERAHL